ncbi:MAG: GNAT family N-acetyltransferase [Ignavibacteria bacterium]
MTVSKIIEKDLIEKHFRKNTDLNLYQIGDLDIFFWKNTDWYSLRDKDEIKQIILIYKGTGVPVMIALYDKNPEEMKTLLEKIIDDLPDKFYSHLSEELFKVLLNAYSYTDHGVYLKMSLRKNNFLFRQKNVNVKRLATSDLELIKEFYKASYPDNWFDKRMLETGKYFGYFIEGEIAGISGIHVYSPIYKVAVLGNITTHPGFRGRSICTEVTSVLCEDLFETVDVIGLNVHSENKSAIRCYEKSGFEIIAKYGEFMFEKRQRGNL